MFHLQLERHPSISAVVWNVLPLEKGWNSYQVWQKFYGRIQRVLKSERSWKTKWNLDMRKWRDSIWSQHRQSAPEWSLPPLWPLHLRHTWEMIIDMMRMLVILRFTWLQVMIHNDQHIMMAGQKYSAKLYFMAIQFHNWRLTSLSGVDWLPPRQRERGQPESSESKSTWALESSESWYRTIPM